jgi:N-acetylglutamate synthase-like GNAT family acetyltransferase
VSIGPLVRLQANHLEQLETLLGQNQLPTDDCADQAGNFFGIFDRDRLVAAGGLEPAGDYFLLRSVVVAPAYRGRGLARGITEFLLERARTEGGQRVYLLTETAADYFSELGFDSVARDSVPAAIARTRQFTSLCPDSAHCMAIDCAPGRA